jgi:hypothetical protein
MQTTPDSLITTDIDFERDGLQTGTLRLPYSHNRSAYGHIPIPLLVAKRGTGPTVLLSGANHGDEYEGPLALMALMRDLPLDRDEALNPFNPFLTMYAATTRRTQSGAIVSGDEAVSREEALRMMTSAAARFSFDEKTRGSIEVGKLADFVVLDADILTCPPERLRAIQPELTVIGGRVVYEHAARR